MEQVVFIAAILLFGGFYDWNIALIGVLVTSAILIRYIRKKEIYKKKKQFILWIPEIIVGLSLLTSFWAIDRDLNIGGIFRCVIMLLWLYLCFQMEDQEKKRLFLCIPWIGAGMTILGILSLFSEYTKAFFWQADRFGGFFQYANTCALFFMIGIMIVTKQISDKDFGCIKTHINHDNEKHKLMQKQQKVIQLINLLLLLVGILLTGSRSIMLILLVWCVYQAIINVALRKWFFGGVGALILFVTAYSFFVGGSQNVARILTLATSNSTVYGRLLYDIDAVKIMAAHPAGLGYMGYYYMQPVLQTGVYTTRFVHNDLFQIGLDYGICAMIFGIVYVIWQLWKGKQTRFQKELLCVIVVSAMMDFHLQYLGIFFILGLCFDLGERQEKVKRRQLRENYFFGGIFICILTYFFIPYLCSYIGQNGTAVNFFPHYTIVQENALQEVTTAEEAEQLAEDILSHNRYVSQAYNNLAYAAAMKGDYEKAVEWKDKVIDVKRYDVNEYKSYDLLLQDMILACEQSGNENELHKLQIKREELPDILRNLKDTTNALAYKLRDVPVFEWEE